MSLKKLADLAKKFQVKLAQSQRPAVINPVDNNTPFGKAVPRPNHPNNPYGVDAPFGGTAGDPFGGTNDLGAITDVKDYDKTKPASNKPQASSSDPTVGVASSMPAPVQKALDSIGAPVLKGNLHVTVDGKNVNARFNNVLSFDANQMKALLTKAFPGYTINVIGEQNPRWVSNY